jgi:hypothetical protein
LHRKRLLRRQYQIHIFVRTEIYQNYSPILNRMKKNKPFAGLIFLLWMGWLCCSPLLTAAQETSLQHNEQNLSKAGLVAFMNDDLFANQEPDPVLCALSMGYWFAKPEVIWPYDVEIGGLTFTQAQGQAFWPPAGNTNHAFAQFAAIYLSGTSLDEFPELAEKMQIIEDYFAGVYPDPAGATVAGASGVIGDWITANHCKGNCPPVEETLTITTVGVSCYGDMDGEIHVVMTGAKPFNICIHYDCDPDDNNDLLTVKSQTAHFTGLAGGWWLVTVVDANGCEYIECVLVPEPDPITATVEVEDVLCYGDEAGGSATITIAGGTAPYTVDGEVIDGNVLVLTGLAVGEHEVMVNDANDCGPVAVTFEIGEPEELVAEVEVESHVSCYGGNDGQAVITIAGGTPPYSHDFDGDLNALAAGTYTINVTDANDCGPVTLTFTISQPPLLEAMVAEDGITDVSCYGLEDGSALIHIMGGTPPYTATMGVVDGNMLLIEDLAAGEYSVEITDSKNCGPAVVTFEIGQPDELVAEISYDPIDCYGGTTDVLVTGMGGTGELTLYAVDGESLIPVGVLPQTVTVTAGGYHWVVMDENECSYDIMFELVDPDPIVAQVEYDPIDCFEGTTMVEVIASGGTGTLSLYDVVDGELVFVSELPLAEPLELGAGSYSWVVMDENGCDFDLEFELEDPDQLLAEVEYEPIDCFEGTTMVEVIAEGGTGTLSLYDVVDGELVFVSELPLAEPLELGAGSYSWVVMDENECYVELEFELEDPDQLLAEVEYEPIDCFEGTTMVEVIAEGGTGTLSLYDVVDEELVFVSELPLAEPLELGAGSYSWVVMDENECYVELNFTLVQPEELMGMVVETQDVTCFGASDGMAVIEIMGGTPPYSANMGEVVGNMLTITDLSAGTYTVEITDSKNCGPAMVTFEIEEGEEIQVILEGVVDVLCYGDATGIIEVSASGGGGGIMYSIDGETWQESGVFEGLLAGTYTVYVVDDLGCEAMLEDIVVEQPDELVVTLDVIDVTCFGANDGQIIGYITGGVGPYNVCLFTECIDDFGDGDFDPVKSQGFAHWNLVPGEYMIVVTDQNGCVWYECVTIGEPEPLVAFIDEWTDVDCHGEATGEATVTVMGGNGGYEFLWSDGQTTQTAVDLVAGTYTVTVTDENGCEATAEVTITEPAMPLSVGVEYGNVSCAGEEDGFIILSPEGGVGEYGVSGDIGALFVQGLGAGTYEFTVTDANGCTVTETVTITEPEALTLELEVTNLICEASGEEAYVSDWVWYRQGLTNAGNLPNADRSDPDVVIGEPEYGDVPGTFFSLGFGGEMIVKFDAPIVNGPGNDLLIVETTFGVQTCETYPERVDVWVAQYIDESLFAPVQTEIDVLALADWVYLGQGCLDSEFDLGDLPYAQYVYMRDVSNPDDFANSQTSDGYDINGLVALHGTVVATADVEAIVGGGTAPYTFLWSNGETSSRIENVGPGTYSVVVTDANGCQIEGEITVECEPDLDKTSSIDDGNPLVSGDDMIAISAYPNPFRTEATIMFEMKESANVVLDVYNLVGERVAVLFDGYAEAMVPHTVTLKAGTLPTGIYFYRLNAGGKTYFNKLILTR